MIDHLGVAAFIVFFMCAVGESLGLMNPGPLPLIMMPVIGYLAWWATREGRRGR